MKNISNNCRASKSIFFFVLAVIYLLTRVCVFTPTLMEKRKHKKIAFFNRIPINAIKRESSIVFNEDKERPAIKKSNIAFHILELTKADNSLRPNYNRILVGSMFYSGHYIDPPKLT